ncbi:MAG TPA: haloacid dehalogenase [Acidimicrobiia bacterium]|nr:haloacid dehalogenase [Acidimicrobiia bacterium]
MAVPGLDEVESAARAELDGKFAAREVALTSSRTLIRTSANAIRALHRGEIERAEELMDQAAELLEKSRQACLNHPDVLHAGFVSDAAKEYAEARLTAALSQGARLPLPAEIGVEAAPYLNGLGEAVGELRRRLLDLLRQGEIEAAEEMLAAMVEVLDLLASLDYPDGMTGGLRRTTDVARALIERSRADLTTTVVQERLRSELQRHLDS